jgi:RNA polymerase sigma factor (TIGR02999 family)
MSEAGKAFPHLEPTGTRSATELLPSAYEALQRLAAAQMSKEMHAQTLQPTALVHEAWLRLRSSQFRDSAHFLAASAETMRRILIDRARRRQAAKRGSGVAPINVDKIDVPYLVAEEDWLVSLNEALERLAAIDPRKAELVKLRYFVGLSFEEAASALQIAVPTAKQWWSFARAWLGVEMRRGKRS